MDLPPIAPAWDPAAGPAVVLTLAAAALFVLFHYRLEPAICQEFVASRRRVPPDGEPVPLPFGLSVQAAGVLVRRCAGGLFLLVGMLLAEALVGALGSFPVAASLALPHPARTLLLGLAPLLLIGPVLALAARSPRVQSLQPEIRSALQPPRLVALSMLGWAVYLLGYEHLFRGPLLVTLAALLGVGPALALTAALYSFAHLGKPLLGEALLSLPLGILLGALALHSGSVWAPFLLHFGIAAITEVAAGRAHPTIAYGRSR